MKLRSTLLGLVLLVMSACVTGVSSTQESSRKSIDSLSVTLLQDKGGFTLSQAGEDLTGSELFAVSPYPELGEKFKSMPTATDVARFRDRNKKILALPNRSLGGWCDGDGNTPPCYLDVSVTLMDEDKAIALGQACNQQSIAKLTQEVRFIQTGGDGRPVTGAALQKCREARSQAVED